VAISIPARVNVQSGAQAGAQAASDRLDKLEEDLTRLTVIVEKMTEKNQQIDVDLARLTVLVEELVRRQPPAASGAQ
jgi:ABC-type transporter Mla subunit MlaD